MYTKFQATLLQSSTAMAAQLKIVVFIGSCRENRNADRAVNFIKSLLEKHNCAVTLLDPKEMKLPVLETPFPYFPDPSKAPECLQKANELIKHADGYVFVTPEYNRNVPPALSNLIDHFGPSVFAWKAALTVGYSTGPFGGTNATTLLLSILREMGLHISPALVNIPTIGMALNQAGELQPGFDFVQNSANLALAQLIWLATVLKKGRAEQKPPKVQTFVPE